MYFSDSTGNFPQYVAVLFSRRASVQQTHSVLLKTISSPPHPPHSKPPSCLSCKKPPGVKLMILGSTDLNIPYTSKPTYNYQMTCPLPSLSEWSTFIFYIY